MNNIILKLLFFAGFCCSTVYEVGPSQALSSIGDVPFENLVAGDVVRIHYRPEPYYEKFVIAKSGTVQQPIVISGVPNSNGDLPIIHGAGATTRLQLSFSNEVRGLIKVGNGPIEQAENIIIEKLDLTGANETNQFTDDSGATQTYAKNAACIYLSNGENITMRDSIIHGCGNGIFIGHYDGLTKTNMIENNYIYGNGVVGSFLEHNTYTSSMGLIYQFNRFGPLCSGCTGNNLKDRSAGLIVRYNWIQDGNRQLDLVDEGDFLTLSPLLYSETYVYGNVLTENESGNRQVVHYGGDSGNLANWRKGTLYMYCNTIISFNTGRTTLLFMDDNDAAADVRNNIIYITGSEIEMLGEEKGHLTLTNNLFKLNYRNAVSTGGGGSVTYINNSIVQESGDVTASLFNDFQNEDYSLKVDSLAIGIGTNLNSKVLPAQDVTKQYVPHLKFEGRLNTLDAGAFGLLSGTTSSASQTTVPTTSQTTVPTTSQTTMSSQASSESSSSESSTSRLSQTKSSQISQTTESSQTSQTAMSSQASSESSGSKSSGSRLSTESQMSQTKESSEKTGSAQTSQSSEATKSSSIVSESETSNTGSETSCKVGSDCESGTCLFGGKCLDAENSSSSKMSFSLLVSAFALLQIFFKIN